MIQQYYAKKRIKELTDPKAEPVQKSPGLFQRLWHFLFHRKDKIALPPTP